MIGSFSEESLKILDFVRCVRADGTFYGTSGRCRKGRETGPKIRKEQGKYIGGGKEGKVYDIDRERVLKIGKYEGEGAQAHAIAAKEGLAPKLYKAGETKSGKGYQVMERIKTSDIPGLAYPDGKPAKEIEELNSKDLKREKQAYLATLTLNSKGVSHEDLHSGNLKWDENKQRPVIMDFDNARVNPKAGRLEAASTLNSIGIRLENSGYYDEADRFYRLRTKFTKSTDKTAGKLFEAAANLLETDFPG